MRLFGLEISKAPPPVTKNLLWNPSVTYENGMQINNMTPPQLRRELTWVLEQVQESRRGEALIILKPDDVFQRLRIINS